MTNETNTETEELTPKEAAKLIMEWEGWNDEGDDE